MKGKLTLCASVLLLTIGSVSIARSAPSPRPADEKAVAVRSLAFAKAALTGDLAAFCAYMSKDYVMMWVEPGTSGEKAHWATKTRDQWVEELRSRKNKYHSVELLNTKVYLHDNVAILTGDYAQTGTRDGADYSESGLFTETWVKRNGQWVIVGSVFP